MSQTVVAQQVDDGDDANETAPDTATDNGTEPEAADSGTTTNETDGDTDEQDAEPEAFDPRLDLDCYLLSVDGEAYDSVELRFTDGTTVTFDEGYSGATDFGYSGDGRLDVGDETAVSEFHGPIAWATVVDGEATETVRNSGRCPFDDLSFDCDSAQFSRGNDVRMRFVDGSAKRWDPPADADQTRFGSPGRVVESVREESADIEVTNPNRDCEPGGYATVFDCTEVTVGPAEFTTEPTFDRAMLTFVDGATQSFGGQGDESAFSAPETFAGTEDNAGKIIDAVAIEKRDGDITFQLVNPSVDDCEAAPADGQAASTDSEVASTDGESTSTDGEAATGTDTTAGGAGSDIESDTGEPRSSPPSADSTDVDESVAPDESTATDGSAVDGVGSSHLPWWGWMAAAGGAAGTVSYLVSRTLGGAPASVDSASRDTEGSESVDHETDGSTSVDESTNR